MTKDDVLQYLKSAGIETSGHIVADADEGNRLFVPVLVSRNADNRQVPSNRTLHDHVERLAVQGVEVQFLLKDADALDYEVGLRATLLHSHISYLRNVFLSLEGAGAYVWIEPKGLLEPDVMASITERAKQQLELLGLRLLGVESTVRQNLPSKFACLVTVRELAPVDVQGLANALRTKDFIVPSDQWLVRRLDALRKGGQLVRLSSGAYTLTATTLHALGTAKNRASPDVHRLLALARRRE